MYHSNDFFLAPFPTNIIRLFQNQMDLSLSSKQHKYSHVTGSVLCGEHGSRPVLEARRAAAPVLSLGCASSRLGPPIILSHRAGPLPPHDREGL